MNIATDPIHLLDRLEYQPQASEIPPHVFDPTHLTIGGLYAGALDCRDRDAADEYLRGVAIHHLRFTTVYEPDEKRIRQCTLREAFHESRVGIWWYALARDVGCGDTLQHVQHNGQWVTVERRTARDHVERWFGCANPLKPRIEDLADKAYHKLEKRSRKGGAVPWRKHKPAEFRLPEVTRSAPLGQTLVSTIPPPLPVLPREAGCDGKIAQCPMDIDDFAIRDKGIVVQSAHNNSSDRRAVTRKPLLTK